MASSRPPSPPGPKGYRAMPVCPRCSSMRYRPMGRSNCGSICSRASLNDPFTWCSCMWCMDLYRSNTMKSQGSSSLCVAVAVSTVPLARAASIRRETWRAKRLSEPAAARRLIVCMIALGESPSSAMLRVETSIFGSPVLPWPNMSCTSSTTSVNMSGRWMSVSSTFAVAAARAGEVRRPPCTAKAAEPPAKAGPHRRSAARAHTAVPNNNATANNTRRGRVEESAAIAAG
mmetsp:Transcript_1201/g.2648  ORF Transcript_1201/g.2648 Transcript_1201/m.2648 type:complete len:231 (+) Transcript_1201:226-918(+)